ncbi:DUF2199 domain-containing protein [Chondrinema litorale]|uniref:DUF2199 domain-containing protein n=1 Tax=Chondrinema litorale TaxID=2994555 RepID=UPI0025437F9F|nr:DUF2199 domain-containing protein [Chondrinema litorale]UZR98348.1 DUF2199 domain-containing protein [Chondrinema litorale]
MDYWDKPERVNNDPYFGWLQNQIPTYENTINIKSKAVEQDGEAIPEIIVFEENHPLTIDQKNGISLEKAHKIVQSILKEQHLK